MASTKCIYRKPNEDDSDDDNLMSPCFQISPDIDLKEVPTNGEEYLLKVMRERKKFSAVAKCDKDYSQFSKNQSCFVKEEPHTIAPDRIKPTIEWQNVQVADFSDIRMYISKMKLKMSKDLKKVEINPNNAENWQKFFGSEELNLCCVLGLHPTLLHSGLEILVSRLGRVKPGDSLDKRTAEWIYAFLVCLRQPLLSDTISLLRTIARRCALIRSHMKLEDDVHEKIAPLNVFICLISRYFGQFDLADSHNILY